MLLHLTLRRWLRDPRRRLAVSLTGVWLISAWHYGGGQFLWWPGISAAVAITTEALWYYGVHRRLILSYSAAVTGLLVGLLMYPSTAWYLTLVVPALAIVLKRLLYPRERPMFNPAALALVLTSLVLPTAASWWGVAWSPWLGLALALSVVDVLWRLKVWPVTLVFLLGYTAYVAVYSSLAGGWPLVFDGTLLSFAFVMLPEPKSGPQGLPIVAQVGFAATVLAGIVLLSWWLTFPLDPLLTALLLASLLFSLPRLGFVLKVRPAAQSPV